MPDDRSGPRRIASVVPEVAEPETSQCDETADGPFAEVERVEDTVPYLPPLASYRIQARWGEVCQGVPTVFPEDAARLDDIEE